MSYAWATDCKQSFMSAIDEMREMYLAERHPGETAEQWLIRTNRDTHYFRRSPRREGPGFTQRPSPKARPAHKFDGGTE